MDPGEIETLYARVGGILLRRCAALLGDLEEARDMTQEAFVRMVRHATDLSDPEHYLPWLYRVSTNLCLDRLRARRHPASLPRGELPDAIDPVGSEERLILRDQLRHVMDTLDDRAQRVFVMLALDGLTQEEVAQVLGLSRRTVGTIVARLRARLEDVQPGGEADHG